MIPNRKVTRQTQHGEIQRKKAPEKCSQNIITYPQITTKSQINNRIRNLKDSHTR